jgi:hypothetical protein
MLAALRWAIVATRRLGFLWLPLTLCALTAVLGLNLKMKNWFQLFQFTYYGTTCSLTEEGRLEDVREKGTEEDICT